MTRFNMRLMTLDRLLYRPDAPVPRGPRGGKRRFPRTKRVQKFRPFGLMSSAEAVAERQNFWGSLRRGVSHEWVSAASKEEVPLKRAFLSAAWIAEASAVANVSY